MEININNFKLTHENLSEKEWEKFKKNINCINESMKEKRIYNVDYKEVNTVLSRRMESVYDNITLEERHKRKAYTSDSDIPEDVMNAFNIVSSFTNVTALEKRLKKCIHKEDSFYIVMKDFVNEYIDLALTMKELKKYIVKGRKPSLNTKPTIENPNKIIKTCPCCFRQIAISSDGTMVNHGYRRYGIGMNVGNCYGVGFKPLEESNEGLIFMRDLYAKKITEANETLIAMNNAKEIKFKGIKNNIIVIHDSDSNFEVHKNRMIQKEKSNIKIFKSQYDYFCKKIQEWKPQEK